jgi:endonuclease/exonuclease/phosphatase family metal-dependent hydrolase
MDDVLAGNFASCRWQFWRPQAIRVINWNIDRGLRLQEITDFLASQQADLLTLQEVDLNARRTHFRNVAEELARKLQMNYVFGREFEELTQGTRTSPAYHGQATLSRWRLKNARVIGFGTSPGSGVRDGFCRVRSLFRNGLVGALL